MTDSMARVEGNDFGHIIAIKRYYSSNERTRGKREETRAEGQEFRDKRTQNGFVEETGSTSGLSSCGGSTVDISTLPQATETSDTSGTVQASGNHHSLEATKRLKRLKIYYAKRNESKKTGRKLLKLKTVCIYETAQSSNNNIDGSSKQAAAAAATTTTRCNGKRQQQKQQRAETEATKATAETRQPLNIDDYAQLFEAMLARQRKQRPRRLLLFVNPFGGKGKALHLFKTRVRPLLELAQIDYKLIVTKYANHARETIEDAQLNLQQFDGIVCIGGDGMFAELMNGLLFRCNRELLANDFGERHLGESRNFATKCEQQNSLVALKTEKNTANEEMQMFRFALGGFGRRFESPVLPIGVIGAGSTDANLFGFIGTNDVTTATLNIILGKQISVDVCSIHALEDDRLLRFASTFVAYGYFGDVVRESEKLRWLGPSRYDLSAVSNLIKCRAYEGLVRIWRSLNDGEPSNLARCNEHCTTCVGGLCEKNKDTRQETGGLKLELVECQGPFMGVNAAVTACRCPQTKKGFSPGNHLANGCADLILVRPCTRIQYVNYLIRTGYTKKSAFDLKYVEAYRCRQFEFLVCDQQQNESRQDEKGDYSISDANKAQMPRHQLSGSSWNTDGEILHEQSIRVKVNKRLLRVFGTGERQQRR